MGYIPLADEMTLERQLELSDEFDELLDARARALAPSWSLGPEVKLFAHQIVIARILDSYKFVIGQASRRAGKTFVLVHKMLDRAMRWRIEDYPNRPPMAHGRFAYIAPTEKQAVDISWMYMSAAARQIRGAVVSASEHQVVLPNGARIYLKGTYDYDDLRGGYWDGVIIDEFARIPPEAWHSVVEPSLGDYDGFGWLVSTPNGRNHFYQMMNQVQAICEKDKKQRRWGMFSMPADKLMFFKKEFLQEKREMMGDQLYRREYLCDCDTQPIGAFWQNEIARIMASGRTGAFPPKSGYKSFVSFDLGVGDPTAIWWGQFVDGVYRWFDYEERPNMSLKWIAQQLKDRRIKHELDYAIVACPWDIGHRGMASSDADGYAKRNFMVFKEEMADCPAYLQQLRRTKKEHYIEAARHILNHSTFNTADKKVETGLSALMSYCREFDEKNQQYRDKPKHDWASHGSEAFAYGCLMLTQRKDSLDNLKADRKDDFMMDEVGAAHAMFGMNRKTMSMGSAQPALRIGSQVKYG